MIKGIGLLILLMVINAGCSTTKSTVSEAHGYSIIQADIKYLASDKLEGRATGTKGEVKAAKYIAKRFKKLGLKPMGTDGYYQEFSVSNAMNPHGVDFSADGSDAITGSNVIGFLDKGADRTVIVGAHFDHLGMGDFGSLHAGEADIHNGADDNASGTAGLFYLAEKLNSYPGNDNYLFIAFSGEEKGLWGSNYYSKNPTVDLSKVNYMLNMDMIGRLNAEKKLAINAVGTSPAWIPLLETIDVDGISVVTSESGFGASDHTSFYLQDIPVLHFFTGAHEDYHKPTDDEHKINYPGLLSVLSYMETVIRELDDDPKLVFTATKDQDQSGRTSFKVTLGVLPDYLFDGKGMRIDGVKADRPAFNAGIEKGDVVIQMGDLPIESMEGYMQALQKFEPGQTIEVVVLRGAEELIKNVTF